MDRLARYSLATAFVASGVVFYCTNNNDAPAERVVLAPAVAARVASQPDVSVTEPIIAALKPENSATTGDSLANYKATYDVARDESCTANGKTVRDYGFGAIRRGLDELTRKPDPIEAAKRFLDMHKTALLLTEKFPSVAHACILPDILDVTIMKKFNDAALDSLVPLQAVLNNTNLPLNDRWMAWSNLDDVLKSLQDGGLSREIALGRFGFSPESFKVLGHSIGDPLIIQLTQEVDDYMAQHPYNPKSKNVLDQLATKVFKVSGIAIALGQQLGDKDLNSRWNVYRDSVPNRASTPEPE